MERRAEPAAADAPFEEKPEPPEPQPSPPEAALKDEMPAATFTMGAVESAWPALVGKVREAVGPRRYALLKEAAPGAADGNTLTLHVPAHLTFHLESLKEDQALREVVAMAASDLLGGRVVIRYESGPESGGGRQEPIIDTPLRAPDPAELVGETDGGVDPTKLVEDILGGEVVDDGGNA